MILIAIVLLGATPSPSEYIESIKEAPVLTLVEAERLAVSENFDIRIARERLERSALLSRQAYGVVLPTVNANYNLVRNNQQIELLIPGAPEPVVIQQRWQQNASLSFDWTVLSGRSLPLILNAYDAVDQSVFEYEQQREVLVYTTSLAYYNALTADRTVEIRTRALEISKRNAELASAQAELGSATSVDRLRAEVAVATAEQELIQSQIQKVIADRSLAILINRVDAKGKIIAFRLERPPEPEVDTVDLLDDALEQRFDLKLRELDLSIAERLVTESYTKFLPELVISGARNWSDVGGFAGNNTTWLVTFGAQWTIFDGSQRIWEVAQRRYDVETAAIAIEQQRVQIADGVEQSQLNLANAESNFAAATRRAELARKSAELAQAQFEVGAATQLEVLDANRSLADAEAQEALGQLSVDLARVELQRVRLIDPAGTGGAPTAPAQSATEALTASVAGGAPP
ncbi:MAG: TolC family protein [Myxococcota bacterium]